MTSSALSRDCSWLTKDQFALLKPLLPNGTRGKPQVDDRRVIGGIIQVLKLAICFSPVLYRSRNAIERMFCRLKDFRRIAI